MQMLAFLRKLTSKQPNSPAPLQESPQQIPSPALQARQPSPLTLSRRGSTLSKKFGDFSYRIVKKRPSISQIMSDNEEVQTPSKINDFSANVSSEEDDMNHLPTFSPSPMPNRQVPTPIPSQDKSLKEITKSVASQTLTFYFNQNESLKDISVIILSNFCRDLFHWKPESRQEKPEEHSIDPKDVEKVGVTCESLIAEAKRWEKLNNEVLIRPRQSRRPSANRQIQPSRDKIADYIFEMDHAMLMLQACRSKCSRIQAISEDLSSKINKILSESH